MDPAQHAAAVLEETAVLRAAVGGADLSAPVPSCPGWTLTDLLRHVGSVQRWFSVLLRRRVPERPTSRQVDLQLPDTSEGLPGWLADGSAGAAEVFAATDPDAPMWAWGLDQHARFWIRRMLFETLVHRVDAELALGLTPAIDPARAADGIDEFLTNLPFAESFAPGTAELRGHGEVIRFCCPEQGAGADWRVQLRPDGFGLLPVDDRAPGATTEVRARAADLLLFLYGRLPAADTALQVSGDRAVLAVWTAHSAF
ncbi:maleylpyruvate isomerase family mycothiol-dependent enzyme [Streptomyces sp. NPDC089799]|uniref:maleylpyruvate isomerase family mycothiol-dependent enzyme n=1 Tax=Streptomyces sp. NPDC089799 TaxID=3155066 RepID=UPI0034471437